MQVIELPKNIHSSVGCSLHVLPNGNGWIIDTYDREEEMCGPPVVIAPGQQILAHAKKGSTTVEKDVVGFQPVGKIPNPRRYSGFNYPREPFVPFNEQGGIASGGEQPLKHADRQNKNYFVKSFGPVTGCLSQGDLGKNLLQIANGIGRGGLVIVRKSDLASVSFAIEGGAWGATLSEDGLTIVCVRKNYIFIIDNDLAS